MSLMRGPSLHDANRARVRLHSRGGETSAAGIYTTSDGARAGFSFVRREGPNEGLTLSPATMSSPRPRMGPARTSVLAALAALLAASPAVAQRVSLVSRAGDGGSTPGIISARACPTDQWTFRAASGDASRTEAPEVWLARGATCTFDPSDTSCVRAVALAPTRDPSCDAGVCWTFTLSGALLVDPRGGSCATAGSGSTAVIVRFGAAAAAFPDGRIGWDTLAPAPPLSVMVTAPAESTVQVSWAYPSATNDAGAAIDADVVDADVADASDAAMSDVAVADAGDDVADVADADDAPAVADVPAASDAGPAASAEPIRRFWLLCDPADGVDAGTGECPSGGFAGLDVNDDRSLEAFAARCARGTEAIAGAASMVTLTSLPEGRPYRFAVVAEDLAGNRSAPTLATRCATAQRVTDFWEQYRAAGGSAPVSCAASPRQTAGAWVAFAGILALAVSAAAARGRRR